MKNKSRLITFRKVSIVAVLLFMWLLLTVLYLLQSENLTGITDQLSSNTTVSKPNNEFLKGQKIQIAFTAKENYLGQLSVRFYNYDRINSDQVLFRIKEKGATGWFYENIYKTDQFQPNALFPFGFPIIPDSKNKSYVAEVESVKGKAEDAVTVSSDAPLSTVIYQYPKRDLLRSPNLLREFMINKIVYTQYNRDLLIAVGMYLNFIILALVLLYLFMNYLVHHGKEVMRPKAIHVLAFGIVSIVPSIVFQYLDKTEVASTIAVAGYLIITLGVVMLIREVKIESSHDLLPVTKDNKKMNRNKKK